MIKSAEKQWLKVNFKKNIEKRFGEKATNFFEYYPAHQESSQFNLSREESFGIQVYTREIVYA